MEGRRAKHDGDCQWHSANFVTFIWFIWFIWSAVPITIRSPMVHSCTPTFAQTTSRLGNGAFAAGGAAGSAP
jgi:hypothetical protein